MLGNKSFQNYFENLIKKGGLTHAYLFYGPQGVGKRLLALSIAERILGHLNNNPDIKIIDKKNEPIHIADVREVKNFIHLTSFGEYKVVILDNAHNFTHEASNALLKILEEPPGKSVIFLITHLNRIILPTIVSRCQVFRFGPLEKEEVAGYLLNNLGVKKETAEFVARVSNGSLGLALDLVSNLREFKKNITLLDGVMKKSLLERFEFSKRVSGNLDNLVRDWLLYSAARVRERPSLARELLYLSHIVSQPQFNHRLALESFLIKL